MGGATGRRTKIHRDLAHLLKYWRKLAGKSDIPVWNDFRPSAVPLLMGHMFVADVVDGGRDYHYRTYGALMPEIFGADLRGKNLSESPDAEARNVTKATYDEVLAERRPVLHRAELSWADGGSYRVEFLLLPFVNATGMPACVLGAVVCDEMRENLVLFRGRGPATTRARSCEKL